MKHLSGAIHTYVLLLGSNLGESRRMLEKARAEIIRSMGHISSTSAVYSSQPWGFDAPEMFLNQAVILESDLAPQQLLRSIHTLENNLGRVRDSGPRYSSRIIDIDILHWSGGIFSSSDLSIPHPLVQQRRFALIPLNDLGRELIHPVLNKPYSVLLEECDDHSSVTRWEAE